MKHSKYEVELAGNGTETKAKGRGIITASLIITEETDHSVEQQSSSGKVAATCDRARPPLHRVTDVLAFVVFCSAAHEVSAAAMPRGAEEKKLIKNS